MFTLYWIKVIGTLNIASFIIGIISALSLTLIIVSLPAVEGEKSIKMAYKIIKYLFIITIVCFIICLLTPSKNDLYLMNDIGPRIEHYKDSLKKDSIKIEILPTDFY